ncbi:hypothetical protein HDV05_004977 [Chytridiales sp. JEL 0842]|nr:hypothetical protein HDV05_004977 [Chytridiales sp. JEL 0842]
MQIKITSTIVSLLAASSFVVAAPAPVTPASPLALPAKCTNPVPRTCDFYFDCLETYNTCGPQGYAISYGGKYCKKFAAAEQKFSPKGQKWMWDVMSCLQKELVPRLGDSTFTCPQIKTFAYGTHPGCYVKSGMCELSPLDWLQIVDVIGFKTLIELETIQQQVDVGLSCIKRYLGIARMVFPEASIEA